MAPQQYPLESLRRLRDERADAEAQRLARQVAVCAAAADELAARERARAAHAAQTLEVLRQERERLSSGTATGLDVLRLNEFETARRAQALLLEQGESAAREKLRLARAEEARLRAELSQREAEAEAVRKHEAGFHERAAARALGAEEEAALEQWNARRH